MRTFQPSDRRDCRRAKEISVSLWPNEAIRRTVLENLADSVTAAHAAGDACWTLTMHADLIRLNVGRVETLILRQDSIEFRVAMDPIPPPLRQQTAFKRRYKAIKASHGSYSVLPRQLQLLLAVIRRAHNSFIEIAAATSRVPSGNWPKGFSPSVLEYAETVLNKKLPRPNWRSEGLADDAEDVGLEGASYLSMSKRYERNPMARKKCIERHGVNCRVCGFSFGKTYGKEMADFIHVHHLRPLSEIGAEYEVDPVNDLRPVCPNCHAAIHRRTPPYTIEELCELLRSQQQDVRATPA